MTERSAFVVVGLVERYHNQNVAGIPAQWRRFVPHLGRIPGQAGHTTYGVCFNFDGKGNMDHLCGVEVSGDAVIPPGLSSLRIEGQKYAVFFHREHISTMANTWRAIFREWGPSSGYEFVDAPQFEVYGENFNPQTGNGGVEIWIPIRAAGKPVS